MYLHAVYIYTASMLHDQQRTVYIHIKFPCNLGVKKPDMGYRTKRKRSYTRTTRSQDLYFKSHLTP